MKRLIWMCLLLAVGAGSAAAQRTTFTGAAIIYGSGMNTRTTTTNFTLTLNGITSPSDAQRLLGVLQDRGQTALLNEVQRTRGLGTFSLGGRIARDLGAVVIDNYEGKQRIRAIMDRWIGFGEIWRGSRSRDYPFTYIEIIVDPRTGRGDGTFIAAAKIRWRNDKGQNEVEIEDFGTFPGRLMGVQRRGRIIS
jgi:hypothetical protein